MTHAPSHASAFPADSQAPEPRPPKEEENHGDTQPPADPDHLPLDEDNQDHADLDKFMA